MLIGIKGEVPKAINACSHATFIAWPYFKSEFLNKESLI